MKKYYPHTLLQIIFLLCLAVVFGFPVLLIMDYIPKSKDINELIIFGSYLIGFASIILIAHLINRKNKLPIAFNYRLTISKYLIVLLGIIFAFKFIEGPLFSLIKGSASSNHHISENRDVIYYLINCFSPIFISPILEELVFRGTFLTGMLEKYTPLKAIILTAIFFALVHIQPSQIVPAFFWGLLLGYIFYKTRSIVLCVIIHGTINFSSLFTTWIRPKNQSFSVWTAYGSYTWLIYSIAIVGVIAGCYFLIKKQMFAKYLAGYQFNGNVQTGIDVNQN
jgi:uncharacterized protein